MAVRKKFPALGRGLDDALGRGLDALISTDEVTTSGSSSICEIPLNDIKANPNQPRRDFDETALQELSDSIREIGIIQPITVRDMGDGTYTIIAGERRWRASQLAGMGKIPAYVRTVDDENMMEMALIENIQREDLNAVEVALAYQKLIEEYDLTQEQLSERVGKNRTTVTNYLRLLRLPSQIQVALQNRELDMGHARALLAVDDPKLQLKLFEEMKEQKLSVRKLEEMTKELSRGATVKTAKGGKLKAKGSKLSEEYNVLKENLARYFQSKVQLTCSDKGRGKITIPFNNLDDLERIMDLLDQSKSR